MRGSRSAAYGLFQATRVREGGRAAAGPLCYGRRGRHPICPIHNQAENLRPSLEWTIRAQGGECQNSHPHCFSRCRNPTRCFCGQLHDTFWWASDQGQGWVRFLGKIRLHLFVIDLFGSGFNIIVPRSSLHYYQHISRTNLLLGAVRNYESTLLLHISITLLYRTINKFHTNNALSAMNHMLSILENILPIESTPIQQQKTYFSLWINWWLIV